MGISLPHSSTVRLDRNLNTNCMSPKVHVVYENLFQAVHSTEGKPPVKWPKLIIFYHFHSNFDDSNFFPGLAGEWLTPVDLARRRESELNHLNQSDYQDEATYQRAPYDAPTQRVPPQDDTAL